MSYDRDMNGIILIDPKDLRTHEKVRFFHAIRVTLKTLFRGYFKKPILVDRKTNTILDGHHRHWASKRLMLKKIPCYCVDYLGDESIEVHPRRKNIHVSKEKVVAMGLSDTVFPHKTTKHKYVLPKFEFFPIKKLRN